MCTRFILFSPYSPSMIAYRAWNAGLQDVGIMDHDSVSGCKELIEACKIIGIASTVGFELRVNFSGTVVVGGNKQRKREVKKLIMDKQVIRVNWWERTNFISVV